MNGPPYLGEDVALFIDWENFKISLATGRRHPNVSALKEEVSNLGRVVVAKAYADWVTRAPELRGASQFINDPPALYAAGIEPVYVPTRLAYGSTASSSPGRTFRVKNSVDVKMTADCIECAHSYPNIGTYVLVSGDSDFIHVVNTLRTMGKRVVIIGVSWATSRRLADNVDGLILYDEDVDPVTPVEPTAVPVPLGNGRSPSRENANRPELDAVIREIEEIVRSERQAGGTPLLTSIKQRLMRRFPGFDEKKLGYSGFKKLMARVAQEGNVKLTTAGLVDWATMADEPVPADGTIEGPQEEPEEEPEEPNDVAAPTRRRGRWGRFSRKARPANGPDPAAGEAEEAPALESEPEPEPEPELVPVLAPEAVQEPPAIASVDSASALADTLWDLQLPEGPGDGLDAERVADLIVMADTLENREGISHVAFNYLAGQACQALEQGLEAEHEEITQRWAQVYSRTFVSKMFRELSNGNMFQRGWHSWRDEASGHHRRRRTFNLDRSHLAVQQVLKSRWQPADDTPQRESWAEGPEPVSSALDSEYPEAEIRDPEPGEAPPIPDDYGKASGSFLTRLFRPRS
ncbi:MAG: NYN domain-containing protein [Dehalococcoidia bacterium]|jgi:uncharacterized LabA/DUF88 family protein|nr:NYN domain-containing protein [Dehalococcoidia bacterium]